MDDDADMDVLGRLRFIGDNGFGVAARPGAFSGDGMP